MVRRIGKVNERVQAYDNFSEDSQFFIKALKNSFS